MEESGLRGLQYFMEICYKIFERLRKTGLKFYATLLRQLANHVVGESSNGVYHQHMRDTKSEKLIVDMINPRSVQSSMNRFRIVSRAQTGKPMFSTSYTRKRPR